MEKNVPLLKLIHDPWSIKTMLSSLFFFFVVFRFSMRVPFSPSSRSMPRPSPDSNASHLLQEKPMGRATVKRVMEREDEDEGGGRAGTIYFPFGGAGGGGCLYTAGRIVAVAVSVLTAA